MKQQRAIQVNLYTLEQHIEFCGDLHCFCDTQAVAWVGM